MKPLSEYQIKEEDGRGRPPHCLAFYDCDKIVEDLYTENPHLGKLDMVYEARKFSRGRLNPSEILKAFNKVKENI